MPHSKLPRSPTNPLENRISIRAVFNERGLCEPANAMDLAAAVDGHDVTFLVYLVRNGDPLKEYLGRPDLVLEEGRGRKARKAYLYTAERIRAAHEEHLAFLDEIS